MFKFNVKSWWDPERARRRLLAERAAGLLDLAEFVAAQARLNCPYDASKPPDQLHLRDTIQVISEADGLRHHVIAWAPWAEPVEFGHTMRNGKFYPPNPFMRKAVRAGAAMAPQLIGQSRVNQGFRNNQLMGVTFQ